MRVRTSLCGLMPLILLLSAVCFSAADTNKPRPEFRALKITRPVTLSGKLDDPLWSQAPSVDLRFEIEPGENSPSPQHTQVRALYSDERLYFGFHCTDSRPAAIRSNLTERDKIFNDDFVTVVLDTYGDSQRAYEFAVNPHGIQADLMKTFNSEDETFDIVWECAAEMNGSGWTAELSIPFRSLRFASSDTMQWSVLLYRSIPRETRVITSWTPIDRNNPSELSQAGMLTGLEHIESGGGLEVLPYVLGQRVAELADPSNISSGLRSRAIAGRIGGGIQYSPGPDFTLDAVISPDFSQIESDADQISVNSTFALSYAERRPFFLIGQDLLQTPMYYSRSINNPLWAARAIGKSGPLSYLYMSAYDRNTPFDVPGEEQSNTFSSSMKSLSNIGRIRYDFGSDSYVGGMVFGRTFTSAHNYVVGFDWTYNFWSNWYFGGEGFVSNTKELQDTAFFNSARMFGDTKHSARFDGEQYSGTGLHLVLSHSSKYVGFDFVHNSFSPTYQTYTGLFSMINYGQTYLSGRYTFYFENPIIQRLRLLLASSIQFNFDGILKEQYVQPTVAVSLVGQTQVSFSTLVTNDERFRGKWFENIRRSFMTVSSSPNDAISFSFDGQFGRFIYRSSSPVMGTGHSLSASVTVKPTTQLKLDLSYSRARLADIATNELFYEGFIVRSLAGYQFSAETMLRLIVQYNDFEHGINIYPLFSYRLNAFTTFYTGVTNDLMESSPGVPYTTVARQYFLKLQYLFQS